MSWEAEMARARLNARDAELAKQRATDGDRHRKEQRKAEMRPQVEAVHRVRDALVQIEWRGAFRTGLKVGRKRLMTDMSIPEVTWMVGEDGRTPQTASITYYNLAWSANDSRVILVHTGGGHERDDLLVEDVYFSGTRLREVTPALILRAAARWCVENSIELPLGSG